MRRPDDLRRRHGRGRNRAHRARAFALRRALCAAHPVRARTGAIPGPSPAGGVPGKALRREGGFQQGARHGNPCAGELARRMGLEPALREADPRVLDAVAGSSFPSRRHEGARVAVRRKGPGVRHRGARMRKLRLPLGPVVLDPMGVALTDDDRRRLAHPAVGAVVLFARNYESPQQLRALTEEIARLREPALLVCVDHEGGRVQRFREGFTAIPAVRGLGRLWDRDRDRAREAAHAAGYVIASELAAHGVDFSFAPVLDLDYGSSSVIGDRALHFDPNAVGALAAQIVRGFADAGMAAVGKHFPGHGFALADTHHDVARDDRALAEILKKDIAPYRTAIQAGLAAVMPAHVIYPQCDAEPAGYSKYWLQEVLRGKLAFDGLIFSDDLSMAGASAAGGPPERARAALEAGCDMVLLCNNAEGQKQLLESLGDLQLKAPERLDRMRRKGGRDLRKSVAYREAQETLTALA